MPRPELILIHGAFSRPAHLAAWVARFERDGFRCRTPALPGHEPPDAEALSTLDMPDYLRFLRAEVETCPSPPVLIGHSMGGLLAQQVASVVPCRALVCVASAPPWMLSPPAGSLPWFAPMLPRVLLGRPLQASPSALRRRVLQDLPAAEQEAIIKTIGQESGKAFRTMALGRARLPAQRFAGQVFCISGDEDGVIPDRTSSTIARFYAARHMRLPGHGHWLIAGSRADEVAGAVSGWLTTVAPA